MCGARNARRADTRPFRLCSTKWRRGTISPSRSNARRKTASAGSRSASGVSVRSLALRGSLREPAEQATQTLRNYVASLRKDPVIGAKFGVIALVSLERSEGDAVQFEIACRLKDAKP